MKKKTDIENVLNEKINKLNKRKVADINVYKMMIDYELMVLYEAIQVDDKHQIELSKYKLRGWQRMKELIENEIQ